MQQIFVIIKPTVYLTPLLSKFRDLDELFRFFNRLNLQKLEFRQTRMNRNTAKRYLTFRGIIFSSGAYTEDAINMLTFAKTLLITYKGVHAYETAKQLTLTYEGFVYASPSAEVYQSLKEIFNFPAEYEW
jgi:hypothetical protein